MKATDEMKKYLNSIIYKIDAEIHNELWNKLINIIDENEQLKNCNLQNVSNAKRTYCLRKKGKCFAKILICGAPQSVKCPDKKQTI